MVNGGDKSPRSSAFFYITLVFGLGIIGLFAAAYFGGCRAVRSVVRGNVYSEGYYDGYIQGCAKKADTVAGLGRIYELKLGVHGYGSPVDPTKSGQFLNGSWHANFFDENVYEKVRNIRGDALVRVFYEEKDYTFEGATKYRVVDVVILPHLNEMETINDRK